MFHHVLALATEGAVFSGGTKALSTTAFELFRHFSTSRDHNQYGHLICYTGTDLMNLALCFID